MVNCFPVVLDTRLTGPFEPRDTLASTGSHTHPRATSATTFDHRPHLSKAPELFSRLKRVRRRLRQPGRPTPQVASEASLSITPQLSLSIGKQSNRVSDHPKEASQ